MKLAEEIKVNDRVSFLGIRKDIPALLAASQVFVLPSRYEGFAIVAMEAMAAGLPLILSDFEAGQTFARDGENAIIIRRDDVDALLSAMEKLRDDPALRKNLGDAGQKRAQAFSIEHHIDQLIKIS